MRNGASSRGRGPSRVRRLVGLILRFIADSVVLSFFFAEVECRHINGTTVLKFMSFESELDDCLKAL